MDAMVASPDAGLGIPLTAAPLDFVSDRPNQEARGLPDPCVSTHIPTGSGPAAVAQREYEFRRLADLGIKYIRQDFYWHRIEPEQGRFEFDAYDRLVDEARTHGIGVIGLMVYGNPWATTATEDEITYPPDDPADYGNYVARTAEHFRGRIHRFELWNEANAGFRFFQPNIAGDPGAFARLIAAAYPMTKAVVPEVDIAIGGLFYHDGFGLLQPAPDFTEAMFQAVPELVSAYDAIGVHPYPQYPPVVGPEISNETEVDYLTMLDRIGAVVERHAQQPPRFWVTEIGWPVTMKVNQRQQAGFTARSLLLSAARELDVWCVYTLLDGDDDGSFLPESKFGLLKPYDPNMMEVPEASEKEAYGVLRDLIETMETVAAVRLVSVTEAAASAGVMAAKLYGQAGVNDRLAIWSTAETGGVEIRIQVDGRSVKVRPLGVSESTMEPMLGNGGFRLMAGTVPTLVELQP